VSDALHNAAVSKLAMDAPRTWRTDDRGPIESELRGGRTTSEGRKLVTAASQRLIRRA
jgi:hypothetical protein